MSTEVEMSLGPRRGPGLRVHFTDFANMLKAFIGSNYLTIAFAFRQSGLALGLAGLVCIATLTAHCCRLLAKCKYHAIQQIIYDHQCSLLQSSKTNRHEISMSSDSDADDDDSSASNNSPNTEAAIKEKLQNSLSYGDIGRLSLGQPGVVVVNIAIMLTQFGFCVGYCIFIGNTILAMFPLYNCTVPVVNDTIHPVGQSCVKITHLNSLNNVHDVHVNELTPSPSYLGRASRDVGQDFLQLHAKLLPTSSEPQSGFTNTSSVNTTFANSVFQDINTFSVRNVSAVTSNVASLSATTAMSYSTETSTVKTISALTSSIQTAISTSAWPLWTNVSNTVMTRGKDVPSRKILVLCPVAIFIFMSLIRSVRQLGVISAMANVAIFIGCIEVFIFFLVGFTMSSTFQWYNFKDMAIFFGLVTSSYEGIGTILPIESSMKGNRHNFACFLYGAIAVLTMVLGCFGVLGYLRFGDDVQQMINANIPSGSLLSLAVNICLCIGVLLTYPLMLYPVTDLAEIYLFGKGRICGPKPQSERDGMSDQRSLLPKKEAQILLPVADKVSDKVPAWKRNVLRVLIVLATGGLAVLLRDNFAYISAFVGALGSTMLAYILPCLFHLRLCWSELAVCVRFKDIAIIIIGVACGVAGIYSVLVEIITNVKT